MKLVNGDCLGQELGFVSSRSDSMLRKIFVAIGLMWVVNKIRGSKTDATEE